jgi:polar amino acid transport system substrate-binding protein
MVRTGKILLAIMLAATLLAGCGGKDNPPSDSPSESPSETATQSPEAPAGIGLLSDGVLQVGCEIGYPPFEVFADDGTTPIGLDIDLATALAAQLGLEVQFVNTAWDGIFSGLDANKYDCIISAVTIKADRMEEMDFTQPYIENWQSISVKKGSPPVTSMDGLNGLRVGYQGETTSDEYLTELIEAGAIVCEVSPYDKVLNCYDDLRFGRLDAVLADSTVADGYIAREPDMFEITWLQSSDPDAEAEKFGVAVKKGNKLLLDTLNAAMQTLEENGRLDEIRGEWLS